MAELVRRMTRTSPQQRPTAKEVAETIDKLLKGGGVKVRQRAGGGSRRRGGPAPAANNTPLFVGIGAVVVLGVVGFMMMGGDPPEEEEDPQPRVAEQPPVKKTPVKKTPVKKTKPKRIELGDDAALNQLFADAQHEEKTGNYMEALHLYRRVMDKTKSDPESVYYKSAKAAYEEVKKARRAEQTGTRSKRITLKGSEFAGQQFEERLADFKKRLAAFQVDPVRKDLEELLAKTRKETIERRRIERMLDEMSYLADLIGIVEGRVAGLGGGKEKWELYDMNAETGWIVLSADQTGVLLKNMGAGTEQTRPWSQLPTEAAITLLDAVRSPSSGMDALRLGYYCMLLGDEQRTDQYFAIAAKADPGLRPDIAKLRVNDEKPAPSED